MGNLLVRVRAAHSGGRWSVYDLLRCRQTPEARIKLQRRRMSIGPRDAPTEPDRPQPGRSRAEDILDRMVAHIDGLGWPNAQVLYGTMKDPSVRLLDPDRLRHEDGAHARAEMEGVHLQVLLKRAAVSNDSHAHAPRVKRVQDTVEPCHR